MNNIIKPTIVISIVAFLSAFILSHIDRVTKPDILRQAKEKQQRALTLVLPGYKIGEKIKKSFKGKDFIYWIGNKEFVPSEEEIKDSGKNKKKKKKKKKDDIEIIKAYAFVTALPGYSGDIKSIVGVDENGKILGLSILQQTETPGLGARSTEIASKETFFGMIFGSKNSEESVITPWFQEQFRKLDFTRKIIILKKGDWNDSIAKELVEKNAITAITGSTITSKAVTDSVEQGYLLLKKILKEPEDIDDKKVDSEKEESKK